MSNSQSVPADRIRTILSLRVERKFDALNELSADRAVADQVRKLQDAGLLEPSRGPGTGFTDGGRVAWQLWQITPQGRKWLESV